MATAALPRRTGSPPPCRLYVVSQGTTGTRSVFEAGCALGLAGVHWRLECRDGRTRHLDANLSSSSFPSHVAMMKLLSNPGDRAGGEWAAEASARASEVEQAGISVADNPYTDLAEHVLAAPGWEGTLFVAVPRDAGEWARSRLEHLEGQLVCSLSGTSGVEAADELSMHACMRRCGSQSFSQCAHKTSDVKQLQAAFNASQSRLLGLIEAKHPPGLVIDLFGKRKLGSSANIVDQLQAGFRRVGCALPPAQ